MDRTSDQTDTTLGLGYYARVVTRRWPIVLVLALLGAALAWAYGAAAPQKVTASAEVYPYVITTDPFSPQRKDTQILDGAREARIAGSVEVARKAARALPGTTAAQVRAASQVTVPEDGSVATVTYTAATAQTARRGADVVARTYLAHRGSAAKAQIDVMVGKVTPQITTLSNELTRANRTIATTSSTSTAHARATGDRDRIQSALGSLYKERSDLLRVDTRGGEVVVPAADGPLTVGPRRAPIVATGLAAGAVLGVVVAFVLNRSGRKPQTTDEVDEVFGRSASATVAAEAVPLPPVRGPAVTALRVARERLLDRLGDGPTTVLVVDATGDEPPTVAAGLAGVLAETDRPVRLVFPTPQHDQVDALKRAGYPSLQCVSPTGAIPEGRLDDAVRDALDPGSDTLVVVAASTTAPPMILLELLRHAEVVVPVARAKVTPRDQLEWVREQAWSMTTPVLGAIVLDATRHTGTASGLLRSALVARPGRHDAEADIGTARGTA